MRIELDDTPQDLAVSFAQALVRWVLGSVAVLHGLHKMQHPARFASELAARGLPQTDSINTAVFSLELTIGVCLLVGRFTRTAAFLSICDLAGRAALWFAQGQLLGASMQLELLALSLASCVFVMIVGGGPIGLDYFLRRRARLRAIANDDIWSRPPYVTNG